MGPVDSELVQATFTFVSYDGTSRVHRCPVLAKEILVPNPFELLVLTVITMLAPAAGTQAPIATLKKVAEFDLPGSPGKRFDYLTIDPDDQYLISAHLAAGQTYVIDLRTNCVRIRLWPRLRTLPERKVSSTYPS